MTNNIEANFDLNEDFDEILQKAKTDKKLAETERKVRDYFNSEEYKQKELQEQAGIAELMHQVVGAEGSSYSSKKERNYETNIWNNLSQRLAFF